MLMPTAMYNITGNSSVNFCETFEVFLNFYQIFQWQLNYKCLCLYESFARMNNTYHHTHSNLCQCECSLIATMYVCMYQCNQHNEQWEQHRSLHTWHI